MSTKNRRGVTADAQPLLNHRSIFLRDVAEDGTSPQIPAYQARGTGTAHGVKNPIALLRGHLHKRFDHLHGFLCRVADLLCPSDKPEQQLFFVRLIAFLPTRS